jgi:hypothetical protein
MRRRAPTHHLSRRRARVRQTDVQRAPGARDRPRQAALTPRPLPRHRRRRASNWAFLEQHTERQLIDFFHATEYVGKLAQRTIPKRSAEDKRAAWQHAHCHRLKHDPACSTSSSPRRRRCRAAPRSRRQCAMRPYSAWTYFNNHRHQMDYPGFLAEGLPIGSGVTEAACKTLVKQRLCASGMRWKDKGRQDRAQPARTDQHRRALGAVLAEDRSVRRPVHVRFLVLAAQDPPRYA